jgi:hypothetical protein
MVSNRSVSKLFSSLAESALLGNIFTQPQKMFLKMNAVTIPQMQIRESLNLLPLLCTADIYLPPNEKHPQFLHYRPH